MFELKTYNQYPILINEFHIRSLSVLMVRERHTKFVERPGVGKY